SRLAMHLRIGNIKKTEVKKRMNRRFGEGVKYNITVCGIPRKGAKCPNCETILGNIKGKTIESGHHCSHCGYSARTFLPSLSRRLKKKVALMFIDESQSVKNHRSLRSQCTFAIRPKQRYLISGTIATADVAPDVYAQLKWLVSDNLMFPYNHRKTFVEEFAATVDAESNKRTLKKFYALLDPYQIRRNADDYGVSSEIALPPVEEKRLTVVMSRTEYANYRALSDNLASWLSSNG